MLRPRLLATRFPRTILDASRRTGKKFDSSKDRGDLFEFTVGKGDVIKGWDQGFLSMKVGERAVLRCREDYAYGKQGSPPNIPPEATLDFVCELVEIKEFETVYGCDNIQYKELKSGSYKAVKESGKCTVTWSARSGSKTGDVFAEGKDEEVYVPYDEEFDNKGSSEDYPQCRAFYKCLTSKAYENGDHLFKVTPNVEWTYSDEKCKELKISPTDDIFYTMSVSSIENPKQTWELQKEEKVGHAGMLKDKANGFFKKGRLELAKKLYKEAARLTDEESNYSEEEKKEALTLSATINSNLGLVCIKLGEISDAMDAVNKGLESDPKNVKLLFRRATCHNENGDWEDAVKDLTAALEIDPKNGPCLRLKKQCKAKKKEYRKKQAALAKAFFLMIWM